MMSLKTVKEHPILSSIAATVLSTIVEYVLGRMLGYTPVIWSAIKNTWGWLVSSTPIPHWLLIIIIITALIVVVRAMARVLKRSGDSISKLDYNQDTFYGLIWRWKYGYYGINDLASFCPNCDMQLFPMDSRRMEPDESVFSCSKCNKIDLNIPINPMNIKNQVELEIQRKIRTGEWRNVVE